MLSRFHVTIDFAADRLWLQPYPGAERPPFRKNRAGLSVAAEADRLRVTHVAPGSPAAAQGWTVGALIVAVDGQPITAEYAESPLFRWANGPAGRVVIHEGRPVRFAQDCQGGYGLGVRAFRIDRITPDAYEETELGPVLVPSPGWRATRTHHVDLRRRDGTWVGVVDGAPD